LADQAGIGVVDAARREAGNDPHRPRRIGLRVREVRRDRKPGGASGKLQQLAPEKFHIACSLERSRATGAAIVPGRHVSSPASVRRV
jgi:hypothetical protein